MVAGKDSLLLQHRLESASHGQELLPLNLACTLHCFALLALETLLQLLHLAAAGFKRTSNWLLLGQPPSQFLLFHRLLLHLSPFLPVTSPVLLVQHCQRLLECLVFASHRLHKIRQERTGKTLADCLQTKLALANPVQPGAHISARSCGAGCLVRHSLEAGHQGREGGGCGCELY